MEFSTYLQDFASRHNLSQYQLAEIMEADQPHVSRWILGKTKPWARTEYRLKERLTEWEEENGIHVSSEE